MTDDATFRAQHVGASEVSALFGCNPWLTHFELWHRKRGTIATPEFGGGNERIEWGVRLEPAIIAAAKERYGYADRDQDRLSNGAGLGGHPDRRVICPQRGPGILEVKMVDWLERKKWGDEPPIHYLLQDQSYQGLDNVPWGDVIVLVGGNALERHQYAFRPALYAEIEKRVASFWRTVEQGIEPRPDYSRDGAALIEAIGTPTDTLADLRNDLEAEDAALRFRRAKEAEKAAAAEAEAAKAELIHRIGEAATALLPGHRISANMTKGTPDRPAVAGEIIKGRKGYRRFDCKEIAA